MNHLRAATVGFLAAVAAVGVARALERLVVTGDSMLPVLEPGDRVLVRRGARPRLGQLVAFRDPRLTSRIIVKRVAALPGGGKGYVMIGDNLACSTDSRHFGPVAPELLRGPVIYRYHPEHRRGVLRAALPATRW